MASTTFNHGTRVLQVGENARPIDLANITSIGAVVVAPNADNAAFPLDEPVHFFTDDADKLSKLGATGTLKDTVDALADQGIIASLVVVRVAAGEGATPAEIFDDEIANIVGDAASFKGVHAFKQARSHVGIEPGLLIAPGYTSKRIANAANPVVTELEGIATRLRSIVIADGPNTTKEDAFLYRSDFPNAQRIYAVDPHVKVFSTATSSYVVKPASARVAGLFVKRDKERGGPFHSPSNQDILGIGGTARPISFYDGETDHEANYLNEKRFATIIEGRTLWGNRTFSNDPNTTFVNVVRGNDAIEKSVVKAFRWAMDKNLGPHLGVAIIESLDEFMSSLKATTQILGGRAYFDRQVNSWSDLMSGKLRVEYEAEVPAPLEDLIFGARRNPKFYYEALGQEILDLLEQRRA